MIIALEMLTKVFGFVWAVQLIAMVFAAGGVTLGTYSTFPVGRYPKLELLTINDGSKVIISKDSDVRTITRIPVTTDILGIPQVYDQLSGAVFYVTQDVNNNVVTKQLYVDSVGVKAIKNTDSATGFSALSVVNGKVVLSDYKPSSNTLPAATNYGLQPVTRRVTRTLITDSNKNQFLVTIDKYTKQNYIDFILNSAKSSLPTAYSDITGQGFLVYQDPSTKEIKLFSLAKDSYYDGNYIATNTVTLEKSYVAINSKGAIVFSNVPLKSMPAVTGPHRAAVSTTV